MKYNSVEDVVIDLEQNPAEQGGNIYHPIPFPEFSHLKTSTKKKAAIKKLYLIEGILNRLFLDGLKNRTLLDVGANAGLYAFSFDKKGMLVTAFEPHPRYAPIGGFLAKEKKTNVDWNPIPFDKEIVLGKQFDLAIMMSVFQWMADGEENISEATRQLRYISEISSYLIFELGFNKGKSCIKTDKINHYAELIKLLRDNTGYKYFMLLGKTSAWGFGAVRFMVLCSNNKDFEDAMFRKLIRATHI